MKQTYSIVILHGWGLSAKRFDPLAILLRKKGYNVLVPDFPGFGQASLPPYAFALSDYRDFLIAYLKRHVKGDVVLIGHSFGGRVSLRYAADAPPSLRALILTGTPGVTPVARKKLVVFILLAKIGKVVSSMWPLNLVQEKIRSWYYYVVGAREFYRAEGVMRDTFKLIVQEELLSAMQHVRVPTLLAWGSLDRITPVWIAEKMHTLMPTSERVTIEDADHGIPFKDPKRFVTAIEPFLKRI
jgi:pimeloyl-ACP methyl ester carboxylesterase